MIKKILFLLFLLISFSTFAQTKDSLICKDTTIHKTKTVTSIINYDSIFPVCTTIQVPIPNIISVKHYLNNISAWFYSTSTQDAVIQWLVSTNTNIAEIYGIDNIIGNTTNWKWISRFNDSCSVHGISNSFIWSKATSVTIDLDKFQKAQIKSSCKFKRLKNESEPYNNTITYTLWWQYSRIIHDYALANGLQTDVYVGWHTQQSYDSIRVLYNTTDIHVYLQSVNMGDPRAVYNYISSRLAMLSHLQGSFNYGMINSDETAFAYSYYLINHADFEAPVKVLQQGFSLYAPANVKAQAKLIQHETFVSSYSFQLKPLKITSAVRMATSIPEQRTVMYVNPKTKEVQFIKTKSLGELRNLQIN